jgi:threonine dehydratase
VKVPEEPGSFKRLYSMIYPRSVTEFSYRYSDAQQATVFLCFQMAQPGTAEAEVLVEQLQMVMVHTNRLVPTSTYIVLA